MQRQASASQDGRNIMLHAFDFSCALSTNIKSNRLVKASDTHTVTQVSGPEVSLNQCGEAGLPLPIC